MPESWAKQSHILTQTKTPQSFANAPPAEPTAASCVIASFQPSNRGSAYIRNHHTVLISNVLE